MRKLLLIFTAVFFMALQSVNANDELFKNGLLKMDVYKTAQGKVRVTLYTTKPYADALTVNSKPNCKYVIYMPETSNLLTEKPVVKSSAGLINDVEVKTQPYSGQPGKGYTKITFSASQPVEIVPNVEVLDISKVTENEVKELIAEAKKPAMRPSQQPQKPVVAPRPSVKPQEKNIVKPAPQPEKSIVSTEPRKAVKSVQKQEPAASQPARQVPQKVTPAPPSEPEQSIDNSAQEVTDKAAIQEEVQQNIQPEPEPEPEPLPPVKKHNWKKYIFFAGIILIPLFLLLLLLIGARKAIGKYKEQRKAFKEHLNAKPETKTVLGDYTDIISNEDLDWKEKYQTFVQTAAPVEEDTRDFPQPEPVIIENSNLDELFNEPSEEDLFNEDDEIEEIEVSLDELFGKDEDEDEEEIEEEFIPSQPQEIAEEQPDEETNAIDDYAEPVQPIVYEAEDEEEPDLNSLFGAEEEIEAEEPIFEPEPEIKPEPVQPIVPEPKLVVPVIDEPLPEDIDYEYHEEDEDEVKVISTYELDNTKGFYLVDTASNSALVGYMGENIYVLKEFDTKIKAEIKARLNETTPSVKVYIVRAGNFKALIEVSAENMRTLIEL